MSRNFPTADQPFYQYQEDSYGQNPTQLSEYYTTANTSSGMYNGLMHMNQGMLDGYMAGQSLCTWEPIQPPPGNVENLPSVPNTPRNAPSHQNNSGYDKSSVQQQHFQPPPPGYQHQQMVGPPLTPNNYPQTAAQGIPNGQNAQSPPTMTQQNPMYHQYHPHMNPAGMMPAMYMPVGPQMYQGSPGFRYSDQQQYMHGMYPQQYYYPPPNLPPQMMYYPHPSIQYASQAARRPYNRAERGGYIGSNGRPFRHGTHQETRPESVRSDPLSAETSDELQESLDDSEANGALRQTPSSDSKLLQKPIKQMLQLAISDSKLDQESSPQLADTSVILEKEAANKPATLPTSADSVKEKYCTLCKSNNKSDYMTHTLKDENNVVVCPDAFANMTCTYCKQKGGGDAHTGINCPKKRSTYNNRGGYNRHYRSNYSSNYQNTRENHPGYGQNREGYQNKEIYKNNYRNHHGGNKGGGYKQSNPRTFTDPRQQAQA